MPIHNPVSGGGIIVVNGEDIIIPGTGLEDPPTSPCRIKATLHFINYNEGGDNIGSDWKFYIIINGGHWYSGKQKLLHGQTLPVGKVIYDEVLDSGCMGTPVISIGIRARELDWGLFDDIGQTLEVTALPCKPESSHRRMIIMLLVPEYGFRFFRRLFRRHDKVARLYFMLDIETKCTSSG